MKYHIKPILSALLVLALSLSAVLPPAVYAERENLALGKHYTRSIEPSDKYPDDSYKSTDGVLAGHYSDMKSYGYNLSKDGEAISVDIIIGLSDIPVNISEVKTLNWTDYGADSVTLYTSVDGENYTLLSKLDYSEGIWFDFRFPTVKAKYIKINFYKKRKSPSTDWLFIDEVQVYSDSTTKSKSTNLALKKTYKKSASPSSGYTDLGYESTDGIIASSDYTDKGLYGYNIPKNGASKSVDVTIFLSSKPIKVSKVRVPAWKGGSNYGPDSITVSVSLDGKKYIQSGTCSVPDENWYEINFPETDASYIKVTFSKTRKDNTTDWLFINEIEVYNEPAEPIKNNTAHIDGILTTNLLLFVNLYSISSMLLNN